MLPAPDQLWLAPDIFLKILKCPCLLHLWKHWMVRKKKFMNVWSFGLSCKREGCALFIVAKLSVSFVCQVNEVSNPFSFVFGFFLELSWSRISESGINFFLPTDINIRKSKFSIRIIISGTSICLRTLISVVHICLTDENIRN